MMEKEKMEILYSFAKDSRIVMIFNYVRQRGKVFLKDIKSLGIGGNTTITKRIKEMEEYNLIEVKNAREVVPSSTWNAQIILLKESEEARYFKEILEKYTRRQNPRFYT